VSDATLVIGHGLLGCALARHPSAAAYRIVSHDQALDPAIFNGVNCVINLAVNPAYMSEPYRPEIDFDLRLAELIGGRGIHYVMISSRKVYGRDGALDIVETAPVQPYDNYGHNKVRTENVLVDRLGGDLTILRLSNVVGFDQNWLRPIFMTRLLSTLKDEERITLDISPSTRRDFISDDAIADVLVRIASCRTTGLFNLGSGIALPLSKIVDWMIEAYGAGEVVVTSSDVFDEFSLNTDKLSSRIGLLCSIEMLETKCLELGRNLRNA
jgi:nucleoside-diphosphate-sugar epimerase